MFSINIFSFYKNKSANIAKNRLKNLIAIKKMKNNNPLYISQLKHELIKIICKYIFIDPKIVSVKIKQDSKSLDIAELHIKIIKTNQK